MATMDIFEGDAFSIIELTRALENIPYKPATLSGSGLFGPRGVRSRTVVIESRDGTLSLIPFSERGSAYDQQTPERRDVRAFVCRQFKKQDVIWASEIQQVRDFGTESATQQVQAEVARKLGRLRNDAETTFEYHLFNGIQGLVKDPRDGATVVNYFTEFGITPATEVDFDLDNATPASGALRKRCQALIESVEDTMGGLATGAIALRAECGSAFFADLVAHKEVRETYLNTAAAADLRSRIADEVSFGGITFRRYRGGAGFGVATDKAVFYPEAVDGLFEIYHAPADTFETVNTLGQPLYARMIPDRGSRRMGAVGDRKQSAADLHPPAGAAVGAADVTIVSYVARGRSQFMPARRGSVPKLSRPNSRPRLGCSRIACAPLLPMRMRQVWRSTG